MLIPVNIYLRSLPVIGILTKLGYKVEQKDGRVLCKTSQGTLRVVDGGVVREDPYYAWDILSFTAGCFKGDYEQAFDWCRHNFSQVINSQAGMSVDFLKHELVQAVKTRMSVLQLVLGKPEQGLPVETNWIDDNFLHGSHCCKPVSLPTLKRMCSGLDLATPVDGPAVVMPVWASCTELSGLVVLDVSGRETRTHVLPGAYTHGWAGHPAALYSEEPVVVDTSIQSNLVRNKELHGLKRTAANLVYIPGTGTDGALRLHNAVVQTGSGLDVAAYAAGMNCVKPSYMVGYELVSSDEFTARTLAAAVQEKRTKELPVHSMLSTASESVANRVRQLVGSEGMAELAKSRASMSVSRRINKSNTLHTNEQGSAMHKSDGSVVAITNFHVRLDSLTVYEESQDIVYHGTVHMDGKVTFPVRFSKRMLSKPTDFEAMLAVAGKSAKAHGVPSIMDRSGWRYIAAGMATDASMMQARYGQDVLGWTQFGRKFSLPGVEFTAGGCRKTDWLPYPEYPAMKEYWTGLETMPESSPEAHVHGNLARLFAFILGDILRSRCGLVTRKEVKSFKVASKCEAQLRQILRRFGQVRPVEGAYNNRSVQTPEYLNGLPFASRNLVSGAARLELSEDGLYIPEPDAQQLSHLWYLVENLVRRLILEDKGLSGVMQADTSDPERLGFSIWAHLSPHTCPDVLSTVGAVLNGLEVDIDFQEQTVLLPAGMKLTGEHLDALVKLGVEVNLTNDKLELAPASMLLEHFDLVQTKRSAP